MRQQPSCMQGALHRAGMFLRDRGATMGACHVPAAYITLVIPIEGHHLYSFSCHILNSGIYLSPFPYLRNLRHHTTMNISSEHLETSQDGTRWATLLAPSSLSFLVAAIVAAVITYTWASSSNTTKGLPNLNPPGFFSSVEAKVSQYVYIIKSENENAADRSYAEEILRDIWREPGNSSKKAISRSGV